MNVIVVGGDTNTVIVQQEPPKQVVVQAPGPSMLVGALRWDIAQTLTSPQQAQARSNMGFAAAVIATALAGFSAAAGGTITSADTVLSAFGKVEYRLADLEDGALTGPLTITANSSSAALTLVNNGAGLALTTTGGITAGAFTGPLTGNVTGNVSGSAGSVAAANLTGTTLAAGVTASSLTSLGTLSSLAVGGAQTITLNSASAGLTITQSGAGAALSTNGQIVSTLATGTSPFAVASTTVVTNLNAEFLSGATFAAPGAIGGTTPAAAAFTTISATGQITSTLATGTAPFSVASTTNVANLNASSLSGATFAAPGTIGGGTPGAATFTTLTVNTQGIFPAGSAGTPSVKIGNEQNGFYSSTTNTLDLTLNGVRQVQFGYTASATNYWVISGGATGGATYIQASGGDTNITGQIGAKGTGSLNFMGQSVVQLRMTPTGSAVNFYDFTGAATGVPPSMLSAGSDAAVGMSIASKGGASIRFFTNGAFSAEQFRVLNTASAVNYGTVTGSATGLSVVYGAGGSDTNVASVVTSKGAGSVGIYTNAGLSPAAFFVHTASAVNYLQVQPGATTGAVYLGTAGSDTNAGVILYSKGSGALGLFTNSAANPVALFAHTASAVNYWQFYAGATGGALNMYAGGSDTDIAVVTNSKGAGLHIFRGHGGTTNQFVINPIASAVNYLRVFGAPTGSGPSMYADGTDTNVNYNHSLKGAGTHVFYTGSTSVIQFSVSHTASAVNRLNITGSATGNAIAISTVGSDADRSITFTTAGTGTVRFSNKIYPGTPGAATQTAAGISAGTGAPSNTDGSDGDVYFRSDGGALTSIYQKRAGAWVGIV